MNRWLTILSLAVALAIPAAAVACPNCKDAVEAGASEGDDDPYREAKAYNNSIYVMLAVPYFILGAGGLVGYRYYRAAGRRLPESA